MRDVLGLVRALTPVAVSLCCFTSPTFAAVPHVDTVPSLANIQGEIVNFETPLIDPLLVMADGSYVVAANEPDQRVVFLDPLTLEIAAEVRVGLGVTALAERPGASEIWVSAAFSSAVMVIDTETFTVTHVLRSDETTVLGRSASPGGIAFSPDGATAYVVASYRDAVNRFDAVKKEYLGSVDLEVEHNGSKVRLKEPRAIVRHEDTLYVSVLRSGNQTAAGNVVPLGLHPTILDFSQMDNFSLPDVDVVLLSAIDGTVLGGRRGVGTLIFDVVVNPVNDQLMISHMDSLNGEFIGEASFLEGRVTVNQLTSMDLSEPVGEYSRVSLDDLPDAGSTASLAMPTGLAVDGNGRCYVAAYASARVGVFDSQGVFEGFIDTDAGPRGVAVSPAGTELYVLNRGDSTVAAYDISMQVPTAPFATRELFDPTYDRVRAGRRIFHDASHSGGRSTGCFSCHADLQSDGLAWDLSAYFGPPAGYTNENPPKNWKDRKFSMTTQDLRSLEDTAPYHWRGEKKDIDGFNGAFEELLHGESLSPEDFGLLKDYVFSAVFPANPKQQIDRQPKGDAVAGLRRFIARDCVLCHTLPLGTSGSINGDIVIGRDTPAGEDLNSINPPQLRGLWTKLSDQANIRDDGGLKQIAVTGFGLNSKGSQADLTQFLATIFSGFPVQERNRLESFINQLDTGIAPCANLSMRLDQMTAADFVPDFWLDQVNALYCDVAAHGRLDLGAGWVATGLFFDRQTQALVAGDSSLGSFTFAELQIEAEAGRAELVLLGVPVWSGERIGVDRDRDGFYDGDELAAGTDPADPDSDGDGFWDSYDDDPLVASTSVAHTEAPVVTSLDMEVVTTNSVVLHYTTDTFSPTRVLYGSTAAYGEEVGDPLVLPPGNNHWKRRHQIVLRGLDDGVPAHFQVQTRGQNGVEGSEPDRQVFVRRDAFDGIWIEDITLEAVVAGEAWDLSATVRVIERDQQPLASVEVRGFWTISREGVPITTRLGEVARTGADGLAVVNELAPTARSGDVVTFVVPMYAGAPGAEIAGLVDLARGQRVFAWPESLVTEMSITLP